MATAAKTIDKWKKKKWFKIFAPSMFNKREIGETPAEKPELVIGRTIKVNVRSLTGQIKKAHVDLLFRIDDVQGLNASTVLVGIQVKPETLRRVVRRRNSKIDLVQDCKTKDGVNARVKTTVVCLKKIERLKETLIRNKLLEEVKAISSSRNFEDFANDVVFGNVLNSLFTSLKNIAGIKRIEIMSLRQLNEQH